MELFGSIILLGSPTMIDSQEVNILCLLMFKSQLISESSLLKGVVAKIVQISNFEDFSFLINYSEKFSCRSLLQLAYFF